MDILSTLVCPNCHHRAFRLTTTAPIPSNALPQHGYALCDNCHHLYPISSHILDLAAYDEQLPLTLAGWSNQFPPTPQLYEQEWRTRALTLMTGEKFPLTREFKLLRDWLNPRPGESFLDLGTSTGLYARAIAPIVPSTIYALDLSYGMLREADQHIAQEKLSNIYLLRAPAEQLPFAEQSLDAVLVGGSFNEMQDIPRVLAETYRVTRRDGRMFVMSLTAASHPLVRLLQGVLNLSGIQFPSMEEFNSMTTATGWRTNKQELHGIVLFTLLTK